MVVLDSDSRLFPVKTQTPLNFGARVGGLIAHIVNRTGTRPADLFNYGRLLFAASCELDLPAGSAGKVSIQPAFTADGSKPGQVHGYIIAFDLPLLSVTHDRKSREVTAYSYVRIPESLNDTQGARLSVALVSSANASKESQVVRPVPLRELVFWGKTMDSLLQGHKLDGLNWKPQSVPNAVEMVSYD